MKMANGIAKNAPIAVAYSKKAINKGCRRISTAELRSKWKNSPIASRQKDQTYGMTCFLEKTKDKQFSNK